LPGIKVTDLLARYKNYFLLHLIVFIWGFSPILGKAITAGAPVIVIYRIMIALVAIFIYMKIRKKSLAIDRATLLKFLLTGMVIAVHWICFYQAIKVSNVAVTLACFSTGTLFVSFIEPILYKRKILWYEILFGLIVMVGIYFIFRLDTHYRWGVILGVSAAFLSALFSTINGILVRDNDSNTLSFYELLGGFIAMLVFFSVRGQLSPSLLIVSGMDLFYISLLGLLCTAFTFIVSVEIMKEISPYTLVITVNLETVYGIILAYFLFADSERMTPGFYIGTCVLLAVIIGNAIFKSRNKSAI
jgi:drug/metabolite transporter (DMT)-like permease